MAIRGTNLYVGVSDCSDVSASITTTTSQHLIVISYNLHGFNQGRHVIIELISTLEPDAILVQEQTE